MFYVYAFSFGGTVLFQPDQPEMGQVFLRLIVQFIKKTFRQHNNRFRISSDARVIYSRFI